MTAARHSARAFFAALLALACSTPARAERNLAPPWDLCGAPLTPPPAGDPALREAPQTRVRIRADHATYDADTQRYRFTGEPVFTRADQRLEAEIIDYTATSGRLLAEGPVRYDEAGVVLTGDDGRFDLDQRTGTLASATYRVEAGHLQGDADRLVLLGPERSRYFDVRLSTCNPGEEVWWLQAERLTIDRGSRQGIARNAWLSVQGVPLFYTPYIRFPVGSDRLTGLLAPSFGRSDEGGAEFTLPFYWNIAPNLDSTITPTVYSARGLRLDTELRYLQPWIAGEVRVGVLPDDRAFGDTRWAIEQYHRMAVGEHLRGELVQRRVSDPQWPSDFGDDLDATAESHLESRAALSWSELDWATSIDAQDWQTIDPAIAPRQQPYARQPRIQFRYQPFETGLPIRYRVLGEAVEFTHPTPEFRDTGRRLDLLAGASLPIRSLGWFVEPAVAWRQTSYQLERPDPDAPESPERSLPIYSIDSGLFFERDLRLGDRELIQTLEPRLFYLRVPEREQSELPRFDTTRAPFTFSDLFSENRFTGPDRVGDANQLAIGLTSRLQDPVNGREYLRVSAGQIFYFDDRNVTLSGEPETDSRSDYVFELRANPLPGWLLRLDGQVDPDNSGNRSLRTGLQWRSSGPSVVNLDYLTRRRDGVATRELANVSLTLPVGRNWRLYGGWRYDLVNARTQERFAGIGYESCCYAVRAVHRAYLSPADDGGLAELESQFLIEFELRGLGGIGDRISDFIDDAVAGYTPLR